jgi:hypothetical protein
MDTHRLSTGRASPLEHSARSFLKIEDVSSESYALGLIRRSPSKRPADSIKVERSLRAPRRASVAPKAPLRVPSRGRLLALRDGLSATDVRALLRPWAAVQLV